MATEIIQLPCIELPILPSPQRVRLIGGVEVQDVDVIKLLQPALTPLIPILQAVDAVLAVFRVLESIPSLNPATIADAIRDAAEAVLRLVALTPPWSVVFTVLDSLDAIIVTLQNVRAVLVRLQSDLVTLDLARQRAAELGDPDALLSAISCAEGNIQIELSNQVTGLQALAKLFQVIELLLSLLGVKEGLPSLDDLGGLGLDETIEAIDEMISVFEFVRGLVPL